MLERTHHVAQALGATADIGDSDRSTFWYVLGCAGGLVSRKDRGGGGDGGGAEETAPGHS
ncbi:MAG: hypothetical protein ACOX52_09125 [Verrucomicrobiota bacterium]